MIKSIAIAWKSAPLWLQLAIIALALYASYRIYRRVRVYGQIKAVKSGTVGSEFKDEADKYAATIADVFNSWGGGLWFRATLGASEKEALALNLLGLQPSELVIVNNVFNAKYSSKIGMSFVGLIEDQTANWSLTSETKSKLLEKIRSAGITK